MIAVQSQEWATIPEGPLEAFVMPLNTPPFSHGQHCGHDIVESEVDIRDQDLWDIGDNERAEDPSLCELENQIVARVRVNE